MKVGNHQGSVLSPLVFTIVVNVVTESVSEIEYADDLVLMSETIEGLMKKFWKWKEAFESKKVK